MQTDSVPKDWLRGVLEPCLLALIVERDAYGFELAQRLQAAGVGPVPGGSLYPALRRLEQSGLVLSEWRAGQGDRGRKYYAVTDAGKRALQDLRTQWAAFAASVGALLDAGAVR